MKPPTAGQGYLGVFLMSLSLLLILVDGGHTLTCFECKGSECNTGNGTPMNCSSGNVCIMGWTGGLFSQRNVKTRGCGSGRYGMEGVSVGSCNGKSAVNGVRMSVCSCDTYLCNTAIRSSGPPTSVLTLTFLMLFTAIGTLFNLRSVSAVP